MRTRIAGAVVVAVLAVLGAAAPAGAAEVLELEAAVDGRDVEGAGSSDPIVIDPSTLQQIDLTVTNPTGSPVDVRRVRLQGDVGGLTLVAYDVTTDLRVGSGATETLELPVEFAGLERQALGLLPGGLSLFDEERQEVGSTDFVIDVKGDNTSVMGLFTLFVAIASAVGLVVLGTRISRRTLVGNRFRRGLQFAAVGLGVGVTLVMGLSVLRIVAPTATVWVPLVLIPTIGAGALGYLSPGPLDFEPDEIDELERQMADEGPDRAPVG
jgi:hypothetical protein